MRYFRILHAGCTELPAQSGEQQGHDLQTLIKWSVSKLVECSIRDRSGQDTVNLIILLVFVEQFKVIGEVLRDLRILQILDRHLGIHLLSEHFIRTDDLGQIFPASCCDKALAVHGSLAPEKILPVYLKVRDHSIMDPDAVCIILPDFKVRLHIDHLDTVQRDYVEIPHRLVIFRGIPGRDNDPSARDLLVSESLLLQELKHGRRQRLRHTVDLVDEQDPFCLAGCFHPVIDRSDDLAHGILRDLEAASAVFLLGDKWKSHRTLPGVVRDGIGHQGKVTL